MSGVSRRRCPSCTPRSRTTRRATASASATARRTGPSSAACACRRRAGGRCRRRPRSRLGRRPPSWSSGPRSRCRGARLAPPGAGPRTPCVVPCVVPCVGHGRAMRTQEGLRAPRHAGGRARLQRLRGGQSRLPLTRPGSPPMCCVATNAFYHGDAQHAACRNISPGNEAMPTLPAEPASAPPPAETSAVGLGAWPSAEPWTESGCLAVPSSKEDDTSDSLPVSNCFVYHFVLCLVPPIALDVQSSCTMCDREVSRAVLVYYDKLLLSIVLSKLLPL
jgi:hypothetical protein